MEHTAPQKKLSGEMFADKQVPWWRAGGRDRAPGYKEMPADTSAALEAAKERAMDHFMSGKPIPAHITHSMKLFGETDKTAVRLKKQLTEARKKRDELSSTARSSDWSLAEKRVEMLDAKLEVYLANKMESLF